MTQLTNQLRKHITAILMLLLVGACNLSANHRISMADCDNTYSFTICEGETITPFTPKNPKVTGNSDPSKAGAKINGSGQVEISGASAGSTTVIVEFDGYNNQHQCVRCKLIITVTVKKCENDKSGKSSGGGEGNNNQSNGDKTIAGDKTIGKIFNGGGVVRGGGNPVGGGVRTEPCPFTERKLARTVVTPWVKVSTVARGGGLRTGGTYARAVVTWTCTVYNVFKVFKCSLQKGHAGPHHGTETEEWVEAKTLTETKEYGPGEPITPPAAIGLPIESPPKK